MCGTCERTKYIQMTMEVKPRLLNPCVFWNSSAKHMPNVIRTLSDNFTSRHYWVTTFPAVQNRRKGRGQDFTYATSSTLTLLVCTVSGSKVPHSKCSIVHTACSRIGDFRVSSQQYRIISPWAQFTLLLLRLVFVEWQLNFTTLLANTCCFRQWKSILNLAG